MPYPWRIRKSSLNGKILCRNKILLRIVYVIASPDALLFTTDIFQDDTELFWHSTLSEDTGQTSAIRKKCIYIPMCVRVRTYVCTLKTPSKDERTFFWVCIYMQLNYAASVFLCWGCYCRWSRGAGSVFIVEALYFMCFSLCFVTQVILCC